MGTLVMRRATSADLQALHEFYVRIVAEGIPDIGLPGEEPNLEDLGTMLESPDAEFFLALDGRRVVAAIDVTTLSHASCSHTAYVNAMVDSSYRRRGIATGLCKILFEWVEEHPTVFRIQAEVAATNRPVRALYEQHGFRVEGTHRKRYRTPEGWVNSQTIARLWPEKQHTLQNSGSR